MKQNHGIVCLIVFFSFLMNNKSFSQMDETKINLALVQMTVEGGEPINNIARAKRLIKEAAQNNAQIVLLPEAMDLGWTDPSALTKALPIPEGDT